MELHSIPVVESVGAAKLRAAGLPPLSVRLLAFGESGCCCELQLPPFNRGTGQRWESALVPQSSVTISVTLPGQPSALTVPGRITEASLGERSLLVMLLLEVPDPKTREQLRRAARVQAARSGLHSSPFLAAPTSSSQLREDKPGASVLLPAVGGSSHAAESGLAEALPPLFLPPPVPVEARSKPLGEVLIAMGRLTRIRLAAAAPTRRLTGQKLGHYLVRRRFITAADLCTALAVKHNLPMVDLGRAAVNRNLAARFSLLRLMRLRAVPFAIEKDRLYVAAGEPLTEAATRELEKLLNLKLQLFLAPEDAITAYLYELHPKGEKQFRVGVRHAIAAPVVMAPAVSLRGGGRSIRGRTINASENGLLVAAPAGLRRGELIRVILELRSGPVEGLYAVRHVSHSRDVAAEAALPWRLGLECLEMTDFYCEKLKAACAQLDGASSPAAPPPAPSKGLWSYASLRAGTRR